MMKYKVGDKFIIEILEDRDTCWAVTDYCTIAKTRFDRFQPYEEPAPAILMKKDDILFVKECLDALDTNAYDQGFEMGREKKTYNLYQEKIIGLKEKILSMLEEPAPVVWRDGAVEKPEDGEKVRYAYKSNPEIIYFFDGSFPIAHWALATELHKMLWLPADEFPLPSLPEHVIEPCPVCGSKCAYDEEYAAYKDEWTKIVRCTSCSYRGVPLDSHNKLCRKVK